MALSLGGPANYNPASLGGVSTQPVGQPAPGPAGLNGGPNAAFLNWYATDPNAEAIMRQKLAGHPATMVAGSPPAGQLSLGGNNSRWGVGANGGFVWGGQGPAPSMTQDQILADMGFMSSHGGWNPNGGPGNGPRPGYNPSMLGGVKTQPVGQPAPGPGGLSGQPGSPGQYPGGQFPAPGTPGAPTVPSSTTLPQIPTGDSGFTTTNPTTHSAVPQYGLIGAEDAMRRGLEGGIAGIEAGMSQAGNTLSPYTGAGAKSNNLQAALSGALGPEAQRQAFANYNESPEVAYQREMGEKAIMRNAAAMGGLGGSRVQQELQRHAIGLAQQDYGNAFNRLGSLSAMGQNSANLLGGLQANAGGKVGDYAFGTGQAMAGGRTRAGEMIANNVQGTSASLADMMAKQGTDLSAVIAQGGGNIAQMLANYGQLDSETQQKLAAILANIATGSATNVAGASQLPGINDTGSAEGIGQISSGIAALIMASDIRLKKNVQKVGELPSGTNLYRWEWNEEGQKIAGNQPGFGVIAQEVDPAITVVGPHGYLMVDYSRVA